MKILMVCLGNICRSPLAEGVLRVKAADRCQVDSAGTAAYHVGEAPDARMTATAATYQVDISSLKARQFKVADFDTFDRIYLMDRSNYKNVLSLSRSSVDKEKVRYLLNEQAEVPDPYYGGNKGFEHVFRLVDAACDQILAEIE